MTASNKFKWFSIGLISLWLVSFVLIPNLMVLVASFLTSDIHDLVRFSFTWENYGQLIDPIYAKVVGYSVYLAGFTTLLCLLIGYPAAWFIAQFSPRVRGILLFMVIVPFWTNSLIRTYAIKIILGTRGVLNWGLLELGIIDAPLRLMYTQAAVLIGMVYILLPFMILPLFSSIEKLPRSYIEAARDLGATRLRIFRTIVLPLTLPGIIAGSLMVFLPAMGMFYISDLLEGAKNPLIGNLIKDQILVAQNWPFGASLSVALLMMMAVMLVLYHKVGQMLRRKEELDV
ncbi:spermidine/putrescine ABC transporter permease PotB [Ferrimonas sediminicola]|uniref:Spermidine/putrescine ABC transporter permease PotB n=1 Tax=Ferrimonas sediminicola TaxID=2569538 RepID=A0A4V5NXY7_9GAMM|nr:spermidine/putrescine ABC transporter permease PotB [Ferrimonas sediminicola]TKB50513.1 spermidine/putrescine ABC transporter permease PotB [Ferrimonas sediminicola]